MSAETYSDQERERACCLLHGDTSKLMATVEFLCVLNICRAFSFSLVATGWLLDSASRRDGQLWLHSQ